MITRRHVPATREAVAQSIVATLPLLMIDYPVACIIGAYCTCNTDQGLAAVCDARSPERIAAETRRLSAEQQSPVPLLSDGSAGVLKTVHLGLESHEWDYFFAALHVVPVPANRQHRVIGSWYDLPLLCVDATQRQSDDRGGCARHGSGDLPSWHSRRHTFTFPVIRMDSAPVSDRNHMNDCVIECDVDVPLVWVRPTERSVWRRRARRTE